MNAPTPNLLLLPRAIRATEAPAYLGIDRNRFNAEIKPRLTAVQWGHRTICYDRLDLDAIWEEIKSRNGRPGASQIQEKESCQDVQPASARKRTGRTQSTSASSASAFSNALDRMIANSPKRT